MKTLLWVFAFGVSVVNAQTVELGFQKDLTPEGIAIHPKSKKVYLNSLRHDKIVRSNLDGSIPEDFILSNQHGYLAGFGMTIKGDTLFALGNSLPKINNTSILLLLDVNSGKLIQSYPLNVPDFIYLNDLAISSTGKIFITDSESNNLYTVNRETNQLQVFYSHDELKHSNGIAISGDGNLLYLASYTSGVRVLDLTTKKLINSPNDHKGIDGMKFYNNTLVGIVNSRRDKTQNGIYQYHLNDVGKAIVSHKKIHEFAHPSDIPTTFDVLGDSMYFVTDSQMDNLDQENIVIFDSAKSENYQLKSLKLSTKKQHVQAKRYCTEIGRFDILFDEDEVAGAYYLIHKKALGGVWGKLNGNIMKGRWHDADGKGDIILTFTEDFSFFTADYRSDNEPEKWYKDSWHGALRPNPSDSFEFNAKTYHCE